MTPTSSSLHDPLGRGLWLAVAVDEAAATRAAEDAALAMHREGATTIIDFAHFLGLDLPQHDMLLDNLLDKGRPLIVLATARAFAVHPGLCVSLMAEACVVAGHVVSGHAAMRAAGALGRPDLRYAEAAPLLGLPASEPRIADLPVRAAGAGG